MKKRETEKKEILREIKDVTDFTCSYWWPMYEKANNENGWGSSAPDVIWDIIRTRSNYVQDLRRRLPIEHSINADGYCNMGCC